MSDFINGLRRESRIYFITKTKYHLFGTDFEVRGSMSDDNAVSRFDQVWEERIRPELLGHNIVVINADKAVALLGDKGVKLEQCGHFSRDQKHFLLNIEGTAFIAQINDNKNPLEHTQLWVPTRKNYDTRALSVTFDTQSERQAWSSVAHKLYVQDEELARRMLTSLLRVFD